MIYPFSFSFVLFVSMENSALVPNSVGIVIKLLQYPE